jgi:hypothetical protein
MEMRSLVRSTIGIAALWLLLGGVARAATVLTTAPLELQAPNAFLCIMTNTGTKDIELSFAIFNPSGTSLYTSGTFTLEPLHQSGVAISSAAAPRICQITVVHGGKKSVRASACVRDSGGSCIAQSEAH